ncbi:hypothetical protein EON65_45305 [archaeon]|nr:MAG: hypothetical protein EON65_45305 [archaeon]
MGSNVIDDRVGGVSGLWVGCRPTTHTHSFLSNPSKPSGQFFPEGGRMENPTQRRILPRDFYFSHPGFYCFRAIESLADRARFRDLSCKPPLVWEGGMHGG